MPGKPPRIWGPPLWPYLHAFARIFDADGDDGMAELLLRFFDDLRYVLPCGICRESFKVFWAKLRGGMEEALHDDDEHPAAFVVYLLHDCVNRKLLPEGHAQSPRFQATLLEPLPNDTDDDRLWRFLITMASNYNSNGERDKRRRYVRFCETLAELLQATGRYPRLAAAIRNMLPRARVAETQEAWFDLVYSAYARWSLRPLTRPEAEARFGVCA